MGVEINKPHFRGLNKKYMKIPIHKLLESLGIKDLELKTPEEIEKVKQELDKLIKEEEKKEAAE